MERITVLVVEDHTFVREGLRELLEFEVDLEVVGEAQNGRQALVLARDLQPAVVLMDIAMPLLNGLEAARQIRAAVPNTKIIILSAHTETAYAKNARESGAVGFLLKQASFCDLAKGIREINQGNKCSGPFMTTLISQNQRAPLNQVARPSPRQGRLSSREMEVLQLIAESYTGKQIAAELGVGRKTVEKIRGHLMEKLDIYDLAGLTRYAVNTGIIESSVQPTTL